ncbi:oxygen-insensitive NADPH nitroreductase [Oceanobacter mangrovi]|uniref:oxygen-insensitive NADPH nitroreductase n=1 Tax=Oceanobacter mangrovi TaxID=2862510 RepID=UPI001C8D3F6C|nr:oxygen-insensitive NADPH nitroreductase [Oceanobacter mangrovi]
MNPTIELLKSHRSIRKFTDQPIDPALLEELIVAGQAASSGNNVQAYTVIRIDDPELRAQIQPLAGNQPYITSCAEFLVFCADMKRNTEATARAGAEPVMGMMEQLLVASIDTALMAQNFAVAAESVGLGVCYIGGIRNNPAAVTELLKLPQHVYPVFGMCVGYPDQNSEVKPRLPVAAVLQTNVYDDSRDVELVGQYDDAMRAYYLARTGGNKESTWSEELKPMFAGKLRPHMKDFLFKQGFEAK